jgi:hypothetical protein
MPTRYIATEEFGVRTAEWLGRNAPGEWTKVDGGIDKTLSGSKAENVVETHTGINPEDEISRSAGQGGSTTIERSPGTTTAPVSRQFPDVSMPSSSGSSGYIEDVIVSPGGAVVALLIGILVWVGSN